MNVLKYVNISSTGMCMIKPTCPNNNEALSIVNREEHRYVRTHAQSVRTHNQYEHRPRSVPIRVPIDGDEKKEEEGGIDESRLTKTPR